MNNNNSISQITGNQTMTSLEIAEVTGKNHFDVLKAIRKMEPAWEKVRASKFALTFRISELPNGAKRKDPMYVLTKTECLYIATKFNDEARARLVIRWEELERERLQQQTTVVAPVGDHPVARSSRRQLLVMLIEAEDKYEQAERILNGTIDYTIGLLRDIDQLKTRVSQLENGQKALPSVGKTFTATQLAAEYGMKAVGFNSLLQQLGLQYSSQGQWLLVPDYAGRGYTSSKIITVHDNGQPHQKPFTVWTEAGRQFIRDTLALKGIRPGHQKGGVGV